MSLCQICQNPKRKTRFDSCRITICQWCVSELIKPRNISPHSYIATLSKNFESTEKRKIAKLKNLAESSVAQPTYPEADIKNSTSWALDLIRQKEGLLEAVYRNLIDDKARQHEAQTLSAKRRQDLISNHTATVELYTQKLNEIAKARDEYPRLEASLADRTDKFIKDKFESIATNGQIKLPDDRLLRAYQLDLINWDNEVSSRQDNEAYDQLRDFIKAQDGHACIICHKQSSKSELHVHHIIPLSRYGTNQHVNLVTLCLTCHKKQHVAFDITKNRPQKNNHRQQDNIFVALSIKTTGNLETDEIIEITATRFVNGVNKLRFQSYVYSERYKPELSSLISGISKQTILSAEKPSSVFEKLLAFIGEANLVFHNAKHVLNFFQNYPGIYQSLSRRTITDILKIAEKRKIELKNNQLTTLVECLKSHKCFHSSYIDREESVNIGLAFIALSQTAAKLTDKQILEVSTKSRKKHSVTNYALEPIVQPEETIDYAYQLYLKKQYPQAFSIYRKFAKEGNAVAQYNLGIMYANAQGTKNNDQHAVYCYQKAADQGNAAAQNALGWMYANGRGVATDDQKAVFWYRKAADQGNANAQNNLGMRYANGQGIEKDDQKAVFWYRKAADQGNAIAQNNLGWMYENGRGLEKDDQQAVFWYRKAADQGNADAQNNLGWMYANGRGVATDNQKAVFCYQKAADQGNAAAQNALGWMYANGRGVATDDQKAVFWYRKAADQGNANAQNNLGVRYVNGQGIEKDDQKAVFWYRKAADQGNTNAQINFIKSYKNQHAGKSNEALIDLYHEAIIFGDILGANVCYKMLFERNCSRLSNEIHSIASIDNKHYINYLRFEKYKELTDGYHEALSLGDLETSKNLYIEINKYQRNQFRNRLETSNVTHSQNIKSFDELLDEYHESIYFGDLENAFELFQSLSDRNLNEIFKL